MRTHVYTDADFTKFKEKVEDLLDIFGLHEWHITITHEQIGERVAAQTTCNYAARHALIRLTKQCEGDFGIEWNPERLAIHEVLHLLLWGFCETTAKLADPSHPLVAAQEHAVLNRLMRIL